MTELNYMHDCILAPLTGSQQLSAEPSPGVGPLRGEQPQLPVSDSIQGKT